MSVVTCKCPNCDGGLIFSPKKQLFICEYCQSEFTREQVDALDPALKAHAEQTTAPDAAAPGVAQPGVDAAAGEEFAANAYSCPSCGAEVFTDPTTAASFCFYCHNPVILSGRLDGALRPDAVIPFTVQKDEVEKKFLDWCKSKWFIRGDFHGSVQMEKLTGVYFPFWMTDSTCDCRLDAQGNQIRVWRVGDIEHTETSVFRIVRHADVSFDEFTLAAIDREDVKLANGVYPFDFSKAVDFSMAYLSGFQAEKRGLEAAQLKPEMEKDVKGFAEQIVEGTIGGYTGTVIQNRSTAVTNQNWKYLLLPVWAMTCQHGGKTYYYAVNGQTGKVCGRVPLSYGRLVAFAAGVAAASFVVLNLFWGLIG